MKKKKPEITPDMVEPLRLGYLFPFLGSSEENSSYEHLVLQLNENGFWNEISALVEEHRPIEIKNLVAKKFSRKGKRYGWENRPFFVFSKPSMSPYVILGPDKQRDYIRSVEDKYRSRIDIISRLFRFKKSGHIVRGVHDDEYKTFVNIDGELATLGPRYGKRQTFITSRFVGKRQRYFVDLEHEKGKLEFIIEKLKGMEPSSEARINANYALFAAEYDLKHYREQIPSLEKELREGFGEQIIYTHEGIKTEKVPMGKNRITKTRAKKIFRRIQNLNNIITQIRIGVAELESKIEKYWAAEIPSYMATPKKTVLYNDRANKTVLPNEKFLAAVENLKQQAEQYFRDGEVENAMTLQKALVYLDRNYTFTKDFEGEIHLMDSDFYGGKHKHTSEYLKDSPKMPRIAFYNLQMLTDGEAIARVEKNGVPIKVNGSPLNISRIDNAHEIVLSAEYYGKDIEVRFGWDAFTDQNTIITKNVSPNIVKISYNHERDDWLRGNYEEELIDKEKQGYNGDAVLTESQLEHMLLNLQRRGFDPSINEVNKHRVVTFANDPASRIEIYKDDIEGFDYLRAKLFGKVDRVEVGTTKMPNPSLAERVEMSLYKPPEKGS